MACPVQGSRGVNRAAVHYREGRRATALQSPARFVLAFALISIFATCTTADADSGSPPSSATRAKGPHPSNNPKPAPEPRVKETDNSRLTPDGVRIVDLRNGTGPEAKNGMAVHAAYKGTFKDGKEFDSGKITFRLGVGHVIRGWDSGIPGMKVGGKRKLVIPSDLAYGKSGAPPKVPPDAELTFEVEILSVK
jgi:FKBP-type peptidyl-prolyl cis-trans isomerase